LTTADDLTDAAGTRHDPADADARIVCLVPSITELLFDLDLGDQVVGRTAFCVHPADRIKSVRSVGGTKQVNFKKLDAQAPKKWRREDAPSSSPIRSRCWTTCLCSV
jgi:ABC-type hemin transport system substrate-binding protein